MYGTKHLILLKPISRSISKASTTGQQLYFALANPILQTSIHVFHVSVALLKLRSVVQVRSKSPNSGAGADLNRMGK